jgi:hypothetical protein
VSGRSRQSSAAVSTGGGATAGGGAWRTGAVRSGAGAGAGLLAQADSKAAPAIPIAIDLIIRRPQHSVAGKAKVQSDGPCSIVIPAEAG